MKETMKMIFALTLALAVIASLSTCAFAEYGFRTPDGGYCVDHENGTLTKYNLDGTTEYVNNNLGTRTYGDYDGSSTTVYHDGDVLYQNGSGYGNYIRADGVSTDLWADGSYSVNTGDYIYHYDAFGNMIGVQVYNGAWYETIWG